MLLLKTWKLCLDKRDFAETFLMDPPKSINTINHELFKPKIHVRGFSIEVLKVLLIYLQERY